VGNILLENKKQRSLTEDFKARDNWYSNRSSAVFPVRLRSNSDVRIVFLNYFKIKNGVEQLSCTFRIYNSEGSLNHRVQRKVEPTHNDHSLREICGEGNFDGMVEVEFISCENLRFSFPGIMAFYEGNGHFGAVHAAGRIRNADEASPMSFSEESNWSCKITDNCIPFFHVFNGAIGVPESMCVPVKLFGPNGDILASREFDTGIRNAFASRIVMLDEIFDLSNVPKDCFISVLLPNREFYPRLICGNFHRDLELLQTTHSFPVIKIPDYIDSDADNPDYTVSMCAIPQPKELNASFVSLPTCAPAKLTAYISRAGEDMQLNGNHNEKISWITGGEGGQVMKLELAPEDRLMILSTKGPNVPARTIALKRYQVRGSGHDSSFEINSSFVSRFYPPKYSYWGHGMLSKNFETILIMSNIGFFSGDSKINIVSLTIYLDDGGSSTHQIEVGQDSCKEVYLSNYIDCKDWTEPRLLSWIAKQEAPQGEIYWLSFGKNGSICGDHSF
jgi:hypothetical protein